MRNQIISALFLLVALNVFSQKDPYQKLNPIAEKLTILPFNAVKPTGWIKAQIQENLEGFTGNLDSLAPDLIVKDDIYGKDRLSKKVKSKDVGAIGGEGDWQVQFLWWNSETQSNWRDGYIRSAILSNDKAHLTAIEMYVNKILSSQDPDGYLGIYDSELRYTFDNENGELWAQSSLLRGLLAWYEFKKDPAILNAITRSVANTMKGFPMGESHPFYSKNPNVGGLSHGLTYTDVLEELHRITNNKSYLDYALFLYKDFSEQILNEDAQYKKLLQKDLMLAGHGVHTYEHLRALSAAYYASGNPELQVAIKAFLEKIAMTTTASGGPVGDEWIGGQRADATTRGYEYCSLQELMHSYESLFAKTGNAVYGDKIENIFLNAAQGSRHPDKSCIAYLKSDNSYAMMGGLNGDESDEKQTRYRYSPVHKEAAVCCVPNAGRIAPYYVSYMWMKAENALVATLLGPSEVRTEINGKPVVIQEITNYPNENSFVFEVTSEATFDLKIRKPEWADKFTVSVPFVEKDGFLIISEQWKGTSAIKIEFFPEVITAQDLNGEYYFKYGSLLLAHAIDAEEQITKTYFKPQFTDLEYAPKNLVIYQFKKSYPIKKLGNLKFETKLFNSKTGKHHNVLLQPLAETILRQTTFKKL